MKRLATVIALVVAAIFLYKVPYSFYIAQRTGILNVSTPDEASVIAILQSGKKTQVVGYGKAKVRVPGGSYTVVVSDSNQHQAKQGVVVTNKHIVSVSLAAYTEAQKRQDAQDSYTNKLVKTLPYTGRDYSYRISYVYQIDQASSHPIIVIDAPTSAGRQEALDWVTSQGYIPDQLNIRYTKEALPVHH